MRKAIDLFCGPGGAGLGIEEAGYKIVGSYDYNQDCINTHIENGRHAILADLKEFTPEHQDVDLIWASPPCQPFSQGNVQDYGGRGNSDPRDCMGDAIRIIAYNKPRLVIMENVPGLKWTKNLPYLEARLAQLRELGYLVSYKVLKASDYGCGQARKRLYIVGRLDECLPNFPTPTNQQITMAQALGWDEDEASKRAVNKDSPIWPYERPSFTVVGTFKPEIMCGPGYRKAGDGPRQKSKGAVKITLREAATLQGFPTDYQFRGTSSTLWRQVGDAVIPKMAQLLVEANK